MKQVYLLIFSLLFCANAHSAENGIAQLTPYELVSFDPDQNIRAFDWSDQNLICADDCGRLRSFDGETGQCLQETDCIDGDDNGTTSSSVVAVNPTDPNVVAYLHQAKLYLNDMRTNDPSEHANNTSLTDNICWNPTGDKIALSHRSYGIAVFDHTLHRKVAMTAIFQLDNMDWSEFGLAGTSSRSIVLFDYEERTYAVIENYVLNHAIAWKPNSSEFAYSCDSGPNTSPVRTCGISTLNSKHFKIEPSSEPSILKGGKYEHLPKYGIGPVTNQLSWDKDGTYLAGGIEGTHGVMLWDIRQQDQERLIATTPAPDTEDSCKIKCCPTDNLIATMPDTGQSLNIINTALLAAATNSDEEE